MNTSSRYDVFLSYNSFDKPIVEEMARRLMHAGIQPWLDTWNVIPGDPWQEAIEEALSVCGTCVVCIGPSGTGPWQNEQMRAVIERRVRERPQGYRVIPVLLPGAERGERSQFPPFLITTTWVEFRQTLDDEDAFYRLLCGIRRQEPGPPAGIYGGAAPYRGLQVFDVDDWPFFTGREAVVEWLLSELRPSSSAKPEHRFLGILGPSGTGKSSLARAGLIAAIRQGKLPSSDLWPIAICKPGSNPLESLAVALSSVTNDRQSVTAIRSLIHDLCEDVHALHLTTRLALRDAPPEHRFVVLVDQFEEVWTLCHEETHRRAIIDALLYAATVGGGQTIVILTLRADFYGKCAVYPELSAMLSDHQMLVGPMTHDELWRAIERPALLIGCEFEPGLVDMLLDDVRGQLGGLPLLQHALLELWNRRRGRTLTHEAYQQIGGVEGALQQRAEEVYAEFSTTEQAICQWIFLRLTTLGEGIEDIRRRVRRAEIDAAFGDPTIVDAVLEAYGRYRLLTFDHELATRESTIEVAHEALLQGWDRLHAWIDTNRDDIRVQRRLMEIVGEWIAADKDESFLSTGARLARFEGLLASDLVLTAEERAYIQASIQAQTARQVQQEIERQRELAQAHTLAAEQARRAESERQRAEEHVQASRQLRRRAMYLAGAFLLALFAAGVAGISARVAQTNLVASERVRLAAQANSELDSGASGDLGALLAMQSLKRGYSSMADVALLRALNRPFTQRHLIGHRGEIDAVSFSPDGRFILSSSDDKTVRLWDSSTGREIRQFRGHTGEVFSAAWSPDGKFILSSSTDLTLRLWDVATGKEVRQFKGHTARINAIAFLPDGKYAASGSDDATMRLWDVATGKEVRWYRAGSAILSIAVSPSGKLFVTGNSSNTVSIWDRETGQLVISFWEHTGPVFGVAFSPDGKYVLSGSDDSMACLWDVASGRMKVQFSGHTKSVRSVAFAPDGKSVLTGSDDGTVRLWNIVGGEPRVFFGHRSELRTVAFAPDGKAIISGGREAVIRLWHLETDSAPRVVGDPHIFVGSLGEVWNMALSPHGNTLLTLGTGTFLWDIQEHRGPNVLSLGTQSLSGTFSQDGRLALIDDQIIDVETGSLLTSFYGHQGRVSGVLSPDGTVAFTGGEDKTARIWDVKIGQVLRILNTPSEIWHVAYSPTEKILATAHQDGVARLWDSSTGQLIQTLQGHTAGVNRVAFSSDGRFLVTASDDKTVRIWQVETGQQVQQLSGHTNGVYGVVFSPDDRLLVTGSEDQTVRVWDVRSGQQRRLLTGNSGAVYAVAFSSDSKLIYSAGKNTPLLEWHTDYHDVINLACRLLTHDLTQEERRAYGITDNTPTCS